MQERRSAATQQPLTLDLPPSELQQPDPVSSHSRRSSSVESEDSPQSPRTPLARCTSPPSAFFFGAGGTKNRSSGSSYTSWNSSNHDDEEDPEWEEEHIQMLERALDTLPSHLLTPYPGGAPPPNLIDKIARGVVRNTRVEWGHCAKATRAKLVELARARDNDTKKGLFGNDSASEVGSESENANPGGRASRVPLYRQSSMDFMRDTEKKDDLIRLTRASARLRNMQQRHVAHPPPSSLHGSPIGTRARPTGLRRTLSTTTHSTDAHLATMQSYSLSRTPLKRAPSYGKVNKGSSSPSSEDEEEKTRVRRKNKKAKIRKSLTPPAKDLSSEASTSTVVGEPSSSSTLRNSDPVPSSSSSTPMKSKPRQRMNVQRNPSMLGMELPKQPPSSSSRFKDLPPLPQRQQSPEPPEVERGSRLLRRIKGRDIRLRLGHGRMPSRLLSFDHLPNPSPTAGEEEDTEESGFVLLPPFDPTQEEN